MTVQKVVITGSNGQLGQALVKQAPKGLKVIAATRDDLDLTNTTRIAEQIADWQPQTIINAGAYTAVDQAETDRAAATQINALAAEALAKAAKLSGARLIQVSTDFVFGSATTRPWACDTAPSPINHYGASKLDGERRIQTVLSNQACIVRTAWVYAPWGQNFLRSMLRLMNERDSLGIVADQIGTPTSAQGLAGFLWQLALHENPAGIWHWTDSGVASWYDFACAIQELGLTNGLLSKPCDIKPITSMEYPTPAARPGFSVLDKSTTWSAFNTSAPHWRTALLDTMKQIGKS